MRKIVKYNTVVGLISFIQLSGGIAAAHVTWTQHVGISD